MEPKVTPEVNVQTATMYIKPEKETFLTFLWNSKKKECLGRTGNSWVKITVFYIIYYACLSAFFAALLAVFYQTLDTDEFDSSPTYTYDASILRNPALGYRPRSKIVVSTLIHFNVNANISQTTDCNTVDPDISNKQHYVNELNCFIEEEYINKREEGANADPNCLFDKYESNMTVINDKLQNGNCVFDSSWLTSFGGDEFGCNPGNNWGYDIGSPCVFIKMNRIIDFVPDYYNNTDDIDNIKYMPKDLKEKLNGYKERNENIPEIVWLSCEGEHPPDQELLSGGFNYFPIQGFPNAFFPYTNTRSYRSPLVAVQLNSPKHHALINVRCFIFAKNIEIVTKESLGMVEFELLID